MQVSPAATSADELANSFQGRRPARPGAAAAAAAADRYEMAILAATGDNPYIILNPYISPKVTFHGLTAVPFYLTIRWRRKRDVYKKNGQLLLLFWKFQPYNTLTLWDSLGRVQGKWLGSERDPVNWSGSIGWRRPLLLLFLLSVTYTQVTDVATSGHVATGRGQELCPIYNYIHWNLCSNSGWTRGRRNKSAPLLKRKKKKKKWPPFQSKTET